MSLPSEEYRRFRIEMDEDSKMNGGGTADSFVCDNWIKYHFDEAERKAAEIGHLLFDKWSGFCRKFIVVGNGPIKRDRLITGIKHITFYTNSETFELELFKYETLNQRDAGWRRKKFSENRKAIIYPNFIELAGEVDIEGELQLECYRLPLSNASSTGQFEINAQYHSMLIEFVKSQYYKNKDADVNALAESVRHERIFMNYFHGIGGYEDEKITIQQEL